MYGYQKFMAFLQTEREKKTIGRLSIASKTVSAIFVFQTKYFKISYTGMRNFEAKKISKVIFFCSF
jgi:hypothetical protein